MKAATFFFNLSYYKYLAATALSGFGLQDIHSRDGEDCSMSVRSYLLVLTKAFLGSGEISGTPTFEGESGCSSGHNLSTISFGRIRVKSHKSHE